MASAVSSAGTSPNWPSTSTTGRDFIAVIPVGVGGGLLGVLLGLGFRSSEGPRIAARWIVVALLVIQLGNYFLGGPFVFSIAVVGFLLIFVIGQIIGQITGAFSGE
ncbi:hypothetical protein AB0C87_08915 [Actinomadura sp. NPDC048021]|uniref:hypothetical protein n=1 Tax=Actinomadura sp. NPDC048021 TaxID=3155385 RepID=UPI0033D8ED97